MKYISLLVVFFLFLSCNKKHVNMGEYSPRHEIGVLFDDTSTTQSFLDHIEDINLIPLEADELLLSANPQMRVTSDKIIILDESRKLLDVFDHCGKYLFSIEKKGNGPSEYNNIGNIFVHESMIGVYDHVKSNLLFYDLNNGGIFVKSKHLDCIADEVVPLNDSVFVAYTKDLASFDRDPSGIRIMNGDGKVVKTFLPLPKWIRNNSLRSVEGSIIRFHSELLIFPTWTNKIFSVTPDSIFCKYYLNFGKHSVSEDFLFKNQDRIENDLIGVVREIMNKNWVMTIDFLHETSNYVYFLSSKKDDMYYSLYAKNSKEIHTVNYKHFPEAWRYILIPFIASNNDSFYVYASFEELDNFMKIDVKDSRLKKVQNQLIEHEKSSRVSVDAENFVCMSIKFKS